jgi:hypothetical protein
VRWWRAIIWSGLWGNARTGSWWNIDANVENERGCRPAWGRCWVGLAGNTDQRMVQLLYQNQAERAVKECGGRGAIQLAEPEDVQ